MEFCKLAETLETLHQEYISLYDLGLQKKEQLIHNRLLELTATLNAESKLLKRIEQLEKERRILTNQFQESKGLRPIPNVTFTELGRMLIRAEEKLQLADVQHRLSGTLEQLKQLNDVNQQLISQSLMFVGYSLDLLAGPVEEVVYQHPAAPQFGQKRNTYFDTKA